LKLAGEIGRTGGAGASRQRREHDQAFKALGSDVHAAVAALLKGGVKRRTEAEKHDSASRTAGSELDWNATARRAHTPLEQFTIRLFPDNSRVVLVVRTFHFATVISF
jgi:hypothetical protein